MEITLKVTLLKFIQRKWEDRIYYKCRIITEDAEVLDLNVQAKLVEDEPELVKLKEVYGTARVSIVSGRGNVPTFVLVGFNKKEV